MTYHQTIIIGHLGADPEHKYMPDGSTSVCNFSVAVTDVWHDKAKGKQERTTWYRVAVWGSQAESCNRFLSKGRQVMVTGTVSARAYMSNNGEPAASLDLRAREVKFLGGNGNGDGAGQGTDRDPADIPF